MLACPLPAYNSLEPFRQGGDLTPGKRVVGPLLWLILFFILLTGCSRLPGPEQLSASLLRRMVSVKSYQLSFLLESSGQAFSVVQWYRSPDQVRTDVMQAEQPVYRFVYTKGRLLVEHMPSRQTQVLAVTEGNELFISPLLLGFCQEAAKSSWEVDPLTGLYHSSFRWQDNSSVARQGKMWVDPRTQWPTEIQLLLSTDNVVSIKVQTIVINPPLDASLFSTGEK